MVNAPALARRAAMRKQVCQVVCAAPSSMAPIPTMNATIPPPTCALVEPANAAMVFGMALKQARIAVARVQPAQEYGIAMGAPQE